MSFHSSPRVNHNLSERGRILRVSKELFLALGYRKVTMDEVAADLGMSKKTLYQHFSGKRELFRQTLLAQVRLIHEGLDGIVSDPTLDFRGKLQKVVLFMAENFPRPGQPLLRDLQTEVRDVWEEVDRERLKTVDTLFGRLFEEGIRDGYLRKDVDTSLLTLMISGLIQKLVNPAVLSSLPLRASEVFEQIVEILSFGVFTDTSRRELTSVQSWKRKKT